MEYKRHITHMLKEEHNEATSITAPHLNAIEKLSLNHDSNNSNDTSNISMSSSTPTATASSGAAETVFFAPTIAAAPVEVIGTLSVSSVTHSGGGSSGNGNTDNEASGTVCNALLRAVCCHPHPTMTH